MGEELGIFLEAGQQFIEALRLAAQANMVLLDPGESKLPAVLLSIRPDALTTSQRLYSVEVTSIANPPLTFLCASSSGKTVMHHTMKPNFAAHARRAVGFNNYRIVDRTNLFSDNA